MKQDHLNRLITRWRSNWRSTEGAMDCWQKKYNIWGVKWLVIPELAMTTDRSWCSWIRSRGSYKPWVRSIKDCWRTITSHKRTVTVWRRSYSTLRLNMSNFWNITQGRRIKRNGYKRNARILSSNWTISFLHIKVWIGSWGNSRR